MVLQHARKQDLKHVKRLYKSAFPADERAPFSIFKKAAIDGRAQLFIAQKDGKFCGFAYVVGDDSAAYLFYLAVKDEMRGGGIGSEILKGLKLIYNDKTLFLAREQLDENAKNYDMRVRRRNFYARNGFTDIPRIIIENKVCYDVMSVGGDVSPERYLSLMKIFCGEKVMNRVRIEMLVTENNE